MATRVDLSHFSLAQLKRPTRKTPHRERIAYILSLSQAMLWPILCLNLSLFVTVSTRVSVQKLESQRNWLTSKRPVWCTKIWDFLHLSAFIVNIVCVCRF